MSSRFASDKRALGVCDRCGFTYKLKQLKTEVVKGSRVSTKVCPECYDPDHPQLFIGMVPVYDPQALKNPRPDSAELAASRGLSVPVRTITISPRVGQVRAVVT